MSDAPRLSRTDTYEHTIAGLLTKRDELLRETQELRERMAIVANDVEAIDRVLDTFGYQGELVGSTPRQARIVLFYRTSCGTTCSASFGKPLIRYLVGSLHASCVSARGRIGAIDAYSRT